MDKQKRYQKLLKTVITHTEHNGMHCVIEEALPEFDLPIVLKYYPQDDQQQYSYLLVFPPGDLFLNSHHIGYIAGYVRQGIISTRKAVLLFDQSSINKINRVLTAASIDRYASVSTYMIEGGGYRVDWQFERYDQQAAEG